MALYRIKNPDIRKLALVQNPASGHRWFLFKQQAPALGAEGVAEMVNAVPEQHRDEVLAGFVASIGAGQAQALAKELRTQMEQSEQEQTREQLAALKKLAKRAESAQRERVREGVEALAKADGGTPSRLEAWARGDDLRPPGSEAGRALVELAKSVQRDELRDRIAKGQQNRAARSRGQSPGVATARHRLAAPECNL